MIAARWVLVAAAAACKRGDAPPPAPAPTPAVMLVDAGAPLAPLAITAGNPVLVATTGEPWADGFPLGEPLFALYDNGAVLCVDKTGRHAAMLAPAERDELIGALAVPVLTHAGGRYQAREVTDQRWSHLYIWKPGCRTQISVWGEMLTADNDFTDDAKTSKIPALILFAWKRIQAYPCGKAAPWRFPSVEAIVSPNTPPSTATWPHAWPTVAHERPSGDEAIENVIDLPAEAYDQLRSMARESVQIGAKAYFVHAHVRWPQESLWSGRPPHACGPEPRHD